MLQFCDDNELGYRRSLTDFSDRLPLTLDENYRLAHLPLVAPSAPKVIASLPGRPYEMGRHPAVFSLVLPVDDAALRMSSHFLALEAQLRAAPFAGKIAWDVLPHRAARLHATVCGSLSIIERPVIPDKARQALAALSGIGVELRGLFSGNVNRGRLYLRAYPERRDGENLFHVVQAALGRSFSDLYVVGLYNLLDDLDTHETAALDTLLAAWWDRVLLRFTARELWLMAAHDDLVLDATIVERLPLFREP